ncbi:LIM/homeobox protein Awh-like isoform X3 [Cynoglossus semilaevis]|nr:LIM/homeobox protein Awh-like isoform X3 [Cynoglossus semilaevis]
MTAPDQQVLEDLLLFRSDLGDQGGESQSLSGGGQTVEEEEEEEEEEDDVTAADTDNPQAPPTSSSQEPVVCCGCRGQVYDRFFLLAAGGAWHSSCLRCSQCQCELQTHGSLYCRHGNIYCQQDYNRMFGGGRCSRCSQPIPASALVMRSGHMTFHPQCFCCQECDVTLLPGSLYSVHGHRLLCQSHCRGRGNFPPSLDRQVRTQQRGGGGGGGEQNQVVAEGEESVSSPEPRQAGGRSHRSTKRIRTCFRSEQLRALESYFAQKHNPDGKDWTYLVHRTGLPKRVLQVWFQNARAKLRRSLTSTEPQTTPGPAVPPSPGSLSPPCSSSGQSELFPASTIDPLQLSLITAPLYDPPINHPALFLDYDSQNELGDDSSLEVYEDVEPDLEQTTAMLDHQQK